VYEFLRDVRSRGSTPAYQHRRHREVKAFFSWRRRMGFIEENPFAPAEAGRIVARPLLGGLHHEYEWVAA
jgi:hypothetical protein